MLSSRPRALAHVSDPTECLCRALPSDSFDVIYRHQHDVAEDCRGPQYQNCASMLMAEPWRGLQNLLREVHSCQILNLVY